MIKERYDHETKMLAYLSKRQLNLEKNKIKENFEDMSFENIVKKLDEEIAELKHEVNILILGDKSYYTNAIQRTFFEIGDCAAVLTGLIAKLNSKKNEINDDGA